METVSLGLTFACKFEEEYLGLDECDSKTKMDAVYFIEQAMVTHRLSSHSTSWALRALTASKDVLKEAPSK